MILAESGGVSYYGNWIVLYGTSDSKAWIDSQIAGGRREMWP